MKTIGICIPTYKRPDFLRRCLASIIDQADGLPVQIFVADDSCSDANDEVLREAALRFPALRHRKNETNLGINENIRRVVEMADTDYAWLVGEDDYFLPGALARAVAEVGSANNPFVLCNYALVEDSSAAQARPALDVSVDTTLTADEVIRRYLWSAGFMGACLFDLRSWRRVASDRYHGTYYAHVGHIVERLARPDCPVRILGAPLVSNRAEGPGAFTWRTDALGVFFGFERMCAIARRWCRAAPASTGSADLPREAALPVDAFDGPDARRRHHGHVDLSTPPATGPSAGGDPLCGVGDGADAARLVSCGAGRQAMGGRSEQRNRVTASATPMSCPAAFHGIGGPYGCPQRQCTPLTSLHSLSDLSVLP